MKRIITSALLVAFLSLASFGTGKTLVAEGKSFTAMGNFKIETSVQPMIVNGVELETYVITYENYDMSVTVAVEKDKTCKRYITFSDDLAVQYVCHEKYFGVEKLSETVVGTATSDAAMDRSAYFHQKVISPGSNDTVTCLKLIGAFYPELLKNKTEA